MKTLEMSEKSREIQGGVLTNLISQLLSALECLTLFQITAKTITGLPNDQIYK